MKNQLVQKNRMKLAAANPEEWLMQHHPHSPSARPAWLEAGGEAIALHAGCVVSALSGAPDLRVEIVLAHLLGDEEIGEPARNRIFALAEALDCA